MKRPTETQQQIMKKQISRIFAEDKAKLDEVLSGQGWRYIVAAILIFPLTIIKAIDFLISSPHLWRDYAGENEEAEHKRLQNAVGLSAYRANSKRAKYNEFRDTLDEYNKDAVVRPNQETLIQEFRLNKATIINKLQQKFDKDERLEGISIRVKYTSEGKIESRRVTFGNELNSMLKSLFPSLKVCNLKGSKETYILFEGDSMFQFEQKLRNTFLKPITIVLKKQSRRNLDRN